MTFLEKLTKLMDDNHLNKNTLSAASGIPYTTIDGFYKKGYENAKLSTIMKLANYFDTTLDYLMRDEITDRNYGKLQTNIEMNLTSKEKKVVSAYRIASEDDKAVVDTVLKKYMDPNQNTVEKAI